MDLLHLKAPGNWINDPNGFVYYRGEYHLFYQYFPYAPCWGTMHWGHAVSRDLVHWEHLGVALFPTRYEDQNGCFSGSAVEQDDRLHLFYTGVHYDTIDPQNTHRVVNNSFQAAQLTISSPDGRRFDNFGGKQVAVPRLEDPAWGDRTHTRDPKVWRGADAWYMVLGSKTPDNRGKLLFYRSRDLALWEPAGSAAAPQGLGWMWECPDYFELDGGQVLLCSPMGIAAPDGETGDHTICMQVRFDEAACRMELPETYQFFDYGLDLYAPQSTLDAQGRRVVIAWLRMPEPVEGRWCGMFCLPRVAELKNGRVRFRVHPNAERMYARRIASPGQAEAAGYKLCLELAEGQWAQIGGYRLALQNGCVTADRSRVFPAGAGRVKCAAPPVGSRARLEIYVEPNLIEVFINGGEYTLSSAVYGLTQELLLPPGQQAELYTLA